MRVLPEVTTRRKMHGRREASSTVYLWEVCRGFLQHSRFLLTNCKVQENPRSDIWQDEWILFLTTNKISPSDTMKVKFNSS